MTNSGIGHQDHGLEEIEDILADVVTKVENGRFAASAFLDRTLKLADIGVAHAYMEDNKATGKVVVTIP